MIDTLVLLIFLTVAAIVCHSLFLSRRNIFEPIYFFLMGYVGTFVLQPFFGQEELVAIYKPEHIEYCLIIAWAALVVFYWGYRSMLAKKIFLTIPQPPESWPPGQSIPYALFVLTLGFTSYSLFIAQSGGAERFFSHARGLGNYEGSTAYLWYGRALLFPALAMLFIEANRPSSSRNLKLFTYGFAVAFLLYQVWIGQRSYVFLMGISFLSWHYLSGFKVEKLPLLKNIIAIIGVMLLVGFVANFRTDFYLGSDFSNVKKFSEKSLSDKLAISFFGVLEGGIETLARGEFSGYVGTLQVVPELIPFDFGKPYLIYTYHWIPRLYWPEKPNLRKSDLDFKKLVPAAEHGTITMLGFYYRHYGLLALFLGSFITGVVLGGIEYWRKFNSESLGVLLVYMLFFPHGRSVLMISGIFMGWDLLLPFTLLPILGLFAYLKSKRNRNIYQSPSLVKKFK